MILVCTQLRRKHQSQSQRIIDHAAVDFLILVMKFYVKFRGVVYELHQTGARDCAVQVLDHFLGMTVNAHLFENAFVGDV